MKARIKNKIMQNRYVIWFLRKVDDNSIQLSELTGSVFGIALGLLLITSEDVIKIIKVSPLSHVLMNSHYVLAVLFILLSIYRFYAIFANRNNARKNLSFIFFIISLFLTALSVADKVFSSESILYATIAFNSMITYILLVARLYKLERIDTQVPNEINNKELYSQSGG